MTVRVNGDNMPEANETFNLLISTTTPGYADIGTGTVAVRVSGAVTKGFRLGAGFTHGIDRLDWLTSDRIGFEADSFALRATCTLNPFVTGSAVGPGSRLVGLKANTGTSNASAARDIVRGGGSFDVCSELLAVEPPAPASLALSRPHPNPASGRVALDVTLGRPDWVELTVFDAGGRRVRTVHAGVLPAGTTRLVWDARTDGGRLAAPGAYWMRALAAGAVRRERLVLVR